MTRSLTLAIDDELLLAARKYALERGTSVNQMVREYLQERVHGAARLREAAARMRRNMEEVRCEVGAVTWARDELYER